MTETRASAAAASGGNASRDGSGCAQRWLTSIEPAMAASSRAIAAKTAVASHESGVSVTEVRAGAAGALAAPRQTP